jgi:hypothetical protein
LRALGVPGSGGGLANLLRWLHIVTSRQACRVARDPCSSSAGRTPDPAGHDDEPRGEALLA